MWCGYCHHETLIASFNGTIEGSDVLLVAVAVECSDDVARVIEGSRAGRASNSATSSRCATQSVGSGFRGNLSRLMRWGRCPARTLWMTAGYTALAPPLRGAHSIGG